MSTTSLKVFPKDYIVHLDKDKDGTILLEAPAGVGNSTALLAADALQTLTKIARKDTKVAEQSRRLVRAFTPAFNTAATEMVSNMGIEFALTHPPMDETSALLMTVNLFHARSLFYKTLLQFVSRAPEKAVVNFFARNGFDTSVNFADFKRNMMLPNLRRAVEQLDSYRKIILDNPDEEFLTDIYYLNANFQILTFEPLIQRKLSDQLFFYDYQMYKSVVNLLKPHLSSTFIAFQKLHGENPVIVDLHKKSIEDAYIAIEKYINSVKAISAFCKSQGFNAPETTPPSVNPMLNMVNVVSDCYEVLKSMITNFLPKHIKADTEVKKQEVKTIIFRNAKKMFSAARKLEDYSGVLSLELEKIQAIFEIEEKIKAIIIASKPKPSLPALAVQMKDLTKPDEEKAKEERQAILELEKFKKYKEDELAAFRTICREKQKKKEETRKAKLASVTQLYKEQAGQAARLERDLTPQEMEQFSAIYCKLKAEEKETLNKLLKNPSKVNRVTYLEMETLIGKKLPDGTITGLKGKLVSSGGSHCQIQLPNIFKTWQNQHNEKIDDTLLYDLDVPLKTMGGVDKSHGKDSNNGKLPYSSHYLSQAALTNAGFTVRNIERLLALEAKPLAANVTATAASM